jgi:hypothetical protein
VYTHKEPEDSLRTRVLEMVKYNSCLCTHLWVISSAKNGTASWIEDYIHGSLALEQCRQHGTDADGLSGLTNPSDIIVAAYVALCYARLFESQLAIMHPTGSILKAK